MKGMKWFVCLLVAAVFLMGSHAFAVEASKQEGAQKKCPVMGYPVNKEMYTDYEGKRVYFCCSDCSKEFAKDPDKYIKKMEGEGVTLDPASKGK